MVVGFFAGSYYASRSLEKEAKSIEASWIDYHAKKHEVESEIEKLNSLKDESLALAQQEVITKIERATGIWK